MINGIFCTGTSFLIWGILPIYLKFLDSLNSIEILTHRALWSLLIFFIFLWIKKKCSWLKKIKSTPSILLPIFLSAVMLGTNWLIFTWAVLTDRIIDASLGFFITPLFNVIFGLFLGEQLKKIQWFAITLILIGVLWLTFIYGELPWIGLTIAITFSLYGLLRKTSRLDSLEGLTIELLILFPFFLSLLFVFTNFSFQSFLDNNLTIILLLLGSGPVTAIPMFLFSYGTRKIPLSVVGLLQYIGPTVQVILGVWIYKESFENNKLIAFSLIWTALFIYTSHGIWNLRKKKNKSRLLSKSF